MKNKAIISIWGPILQAVLRNRASANRPKMEPFGESDNRPKMEGNENFSTIYCTNFELKGGHFMKKPTLVFCSNTWLLTSQIWAGQFFLIISPRRWLGKIFFLRGPGGLQFESGSNHFRLKNIYVGGEKKKKKRKRRTDSSPSS